MEWWRWLIVICGFIGFPWLLTYLLVNKYVAKGSYTTALIACLFLTLVLVRIDTLGKFGGMGFEVSLQKIKDIKRDVYAKADAVQKLAEEIAFSSLDLIAINNSSGTTDWVGPGIPNLIASRDRALRILKEAGSRPETV